MMYCKCFKQVTLGHFFFVLKKAPFAIDYGSVKYSCFLFSLSGLTTKSCHFWLGASKWRGKTEATKPRNAYGGSNLRPQIADRKPPKGKPFGKVFWDPFFRGKAAVGDIL